jgi:AraC-like DNA-binding protein
LDRIVFSTDAFPKHERFSAFCEEIVRRFSGLDLRTEDQSSFRANLELRRAGAVDIATNNSVAVNSVRTPGFVRDGDDALIVMLLQGGRAYQTQCGDRHALEPGEAIICDYGYSGEFNLVADSRFLSIKIPRRKLTVLLPHLSRFAGAKLDRDPVALRLLSGYLAGSLNVDLSGSAGAAQLHQDHIIDLVALALGTDGEARMLAEQRGAQAVRRAAIIREIEASIADPVLDAPAVAARLGITVRYVHHLLEPTGRTFSEHVLDRRLARAIELLRDTGHWQHKIADIAFEVGFKDLSYFNRVFRRKYGGTPTDVRQAAMSEHDRRYGSATDE